jgi:DNA-binding MarR family transcriptional regulator
MPDAPAAKLPASDAQASDTPDYDHDPVSVAARQYEQVLGTADLGAIEVILGLIRAQHAQSVMIGRRFDALNVGVSISGARFTVLRTLYFAPDKRLAQNEISRVLGVSRTNVTNLIDGLERDGLVRRVNSPVDRRVSYAQLTDEGEAMFHRVLPVMSEHMAEACAQFSEAEKQQFKSFLFRLYYDLAARYSETAGAEPLPEAPSKA